MAPFTPRPRHLLLAGFGLGLALTASSGTGCGARNRAVAPDAGRDGNAGQGYVGHSRAVNLPSKPTHAEARPSEASATPQQGERSAVVEALQRRAQQVDREMDPASLNRAPGAGVPAESGTGSTLSWDSGATPPQGRRPEMRASAEAEAPAGAAGPTGAAGAVDAASVPGSNAPTQAESVEGRDAFTAQLTRVRTDLTTPRDEGAGVTERLAQRVRDYPLDLSAHMDYQFHRFAIGESVPEMASLSPLPQEDRDALVAMLDGMSNFRNAVQADPGMLLSKKVQPLIEMADRVRAQAELTLPVVALCASVRGFGVYEPLPPSLKAGQDHQAILYVEVGNFSSRRNEKSQLWETKLKQEVVLYTEGGMAALTEKSDIPLDTSRNRRHDFYVYKKVTLPKTLTIGRYFLKVTITDEQANRVAENSLPVQVVAQ